MKKIILASGSPRRKEILKNAGLDFEIHPSKYEEELDNNINIDALSEGGYSGCGCTISLKNLLYKIKDIIPYEWISDMKEDKRDEK